MSTYSNYSNWLTALGGSFTRASSASYFNSSGTLSTASTNALRFDYDPVTLTPKGILLEGARTNLRQYSEDFRDTADAGEARTWYYADLTLTANAVAAPDGNTTADRLVETATTAVHRLYSGSIGETAASVYTHSIFVKAGEVSKCLLFNENVTNAYAAFNLSGAGSVLETGAGLSAAAVSQLSGGWYRISITYTSNGTGYFRLYLAPDSYTTGHPSTVSYLGNTGRGLYVWGAQWELGSFASSYIPTTSASATRAADVLTFPTSPWFNASAGTLFVEASGGLSGNRVLSISTSGFTSRLADIFMGTPTILSFFATNTGQINSNIVVGEGSFKAIAVIKPGDWAFTVNGAAISTNANATALQTPVICEVGKYNTVYWYGHIRKIGYWPFRVTNAELQRITT